MSLRLTNPMTLVIWLAFFTPGFLLDGRVETGFAFAAILLASAVIVSKPSPWESRRPARRAAQIFLLLQFLLIVSYVYSAAFNGVSTGPADWLALPRWLGFGLLAAYLIRHYDEQAHEALETAAVAAAYGGWLVFREGELGYASVLTLCWLIFYSKARRRLIHAAAAGASAFYSGSHPAWAAAFLVLSADLAARLGEDLAGRRARYAVQWSVFALVLLVSASVLCLRLAPARAESPEAPRSVTSAAALRQIRVSPLLGWGPARYEAASSVRNQYLLWALRGGVVSLSVILVGFGLVVRSLLGAAGGDPRRLLGAFAFLASSSLLLMSGPFLESWRLFLLTGFFIAGIHEASR